jgi:L-cysteate sulfo-lyase
LQIHQLERVGFGVYPTPLEQMPRLEQALKRPRLFVKRDDLTGVALGGNKVRQLDYILADAKKMKADYVITTCGIQSNWSRQTVGMAVRMGMKALLVLRTAQFKNPPKVYDGNILLDHIMGAEIKTVQMKISEDPKEILESEAEKLRRKGHNPLVLGLDASVSPLATAGYVDAAKELASQFGSMGTDLDAIVVATGAGPTHAGLALGTKMLGMKTRVIGVNVGAYDTRWLKATIKKTSSGAARLLGSDTTLTGGDITIRDEFAGRDYGIPTKASIEAIRLVARTEALILDPVYTSKAMAGLIKMAKSGEFRKDENVCFIHTGGVPALFAYKEHFQPTSKGPQIS